MALVEDLTQKIQETLDYCRDVACKRSDLRITQEKIEIALTEIDNQDNQDNKNNKGDKLNMLNMKLINRGAEGELQMIGRLDATSAPNAEKILLDMVERFDSLILNMEHLEYISSAGLRALKRTYSAVRRKDGALALKSVNKSVMEVFEITGFAGIFKFI